MTFYGTIATGAGWIVPKKYIETIGNDAFKHQPIGLGPYRLVSHQPGVELVLEAYPGYWRKAPHVKRLVFKSVPEATTRLAMVKQGEADVAYGLFGTLADEVTLGSALSGGSIILGAGSDKLTLANGTNYLTLSNDNAVHLAISGRAAGVVGIAWNWPS